MGGWEHPHITKHEQILKYIENLGVGTKISVRRLAREMGVSEGTAYRAIKDAEKRGLVSTKERIGTVRIENQPRTNIDQLNFADICKMVDGKVLGGERGLNKTLNKFVIGAMKLDAMMQYVQAGSLLIVGNRIDAQQCALEQGAAVLITGGFDTSPEVKRRADELELPLMSSKYDTFTVASMINRAMYDRLIKKKIIRVEDLIDPDAKVHTLKSTSKVKDWNDLFHRTGYSRFPVVDEWNRVMGMITSKDVVGASPEQSIDKLMTKQPSSVYPNTSVASAAHLMVWEGIELLPVIDHHRKLIGVISRKDVLKAMQDLQNEPNIGETFEDLIWSAFTAIRDEQNVLKFTGKISPQMTNHLGTVSEGVLATLITKSAYAAIREVRKGDLVLENLTTYFVRPVQIDSTVEIIPRTLEVSRKFGKVDVEIFSGEELVCKALVTAQAINQI